MNIENPVKWEEYFKELNRQGKY